MNAAAAPSGRAPAAPSGRAPAATLTGVTLRLGARTVLDNATLALPAGAFIGLLGPNGAGKTTLMRGLLGLLRPARGSISVAGRMARPGHPGTGYLPQTSAGPVPPLTGLDLLTLARHGRRWGLPLATASARADIAWALAQTGATALAARPLAQLSGGERQRVLIAQALAGKPDFLLLDEPLAGLDPHHQHQVVQLLDGLRARLGLTILCSAHDLDVLLPALDQVLYLAHGRAALGAPGQVITTPVLTALYGAPIEVIRAGGRVFVVPGHAESLAPGHADTTVPGHAETTVPGHAGSAVPGQSESAAPWHAESVLPGHAEPTVPGNAESAAPGHAGDGVKGRAG